VKYNAVTTTKKIRKLSELKSMLSLNVIQNIVAGRQLGGGTRLVQVKVRLKHVGRFERMHFNGKWAR
jgi:hypothetical protein